MAVFMGVMSEDEMGLNSEVTLENNLAINLITGVAASSSEAIINAGKDVIDHKLIAPVKLEPLDEIDDFQLVHVNYRSFFVPLDEKYRASIQKGNSMDCRYANLLNKPAVKFTRKHIANHKKFEPEAEYCGIDCFIEDCPAYIDCRKKN